MSTFAIVSRNRIVSFNYFNAYDELSLVNFKLNTKQNFSMNAHFFIKIRNIKKLFRTIDWDPTCFLFEICEDTRG